MDKYSRAFYEVTFHLAFRSKSGTEFQDFFSSVMEVRFPGDFQRVKPGGPRGDRKCDGYLSSAQRLFQVYGPQTMRASETTRKIAEDFAGAEGHWRGQMLEWVFVHNQWRGLPAEVVMALNDLAAQANKKGIAVSWCCETELKQTLFECNEGSIASILGYCPGPSDFQAVDFKDLQLVIEAISQEPAAPEGDVKIVPPGKIRSNDLSDSVQVLLMAGSRKSYLVSEFFSKWHDPELGDRVAKTFRARYEGLKASGFRGDDMFQQLWTFARGTIVAKPKHEAAVLAVLAFLFEECEVFEPPDNGLAL
jgi:hypothetical protein